MEMGERKEEERMWQASGVDGERKRAQHTSFTGSKRLKSNRTAEDKKRTAACD
jgi:hypothetical protein